MIEDSVIDELEQRGYSVRKVVKSTAECTKLVVDDPKTRYFVRCYPLKEIFRTSEGRKIINNELTMAENFKKWDLNTCVSYVKRIYTKTTLFMFFVFHRHVTLETLLSTKPLSESQIILVLRDLLAIIYELRGAGVLHRHLSPDKILVAGNQLKFCGFKYCTNVQKAKYDTDEYMYLLKNRTNVYCISPEVLLNEFTGFKTQIFNFGVIMFYLTHQSYPFPEQNLEYLKNIYIAGVERPKIDPRFSEDVVYILQRTLQIGYTDRMALSELKLTIGAMYKTIVHEEESIRTKLYSTMNPTIKIEDTIIPKNVLKEQLFGVSTKTKPSGAPSKSAGRQKYAPTNPFSLPIIKRAVGNVPKVIENQARVETGAGIKDYPHHNISDFTMSNSSRHGNSTWANSSSHLELLLYRKEKFVPRLLGKNLMGHRNYSPPGREGKSPKASRFDRRKSQADQDSQFNTSSVIEQGPNQSQTVLGSGASRPQLRASQPFL